MGDEEFAIYIIKSLIRISGIGGDLGKNLALRYTNKIMSADPDKQKYKEWLDIIPSNGGRKWYARALKKAQEMEEEK